MNDQFSVTYEGGYIKVDLRGREDIEVASLLWPQVKEACEANGCFKVLGVADTTKPLGVMDSYKHAELFSSLGINYKYRIAWVELNSEAFNATSFTETILHNR